VRRGEGISENGRLGRERRRKGRNEKGVKRSGLPTVSSHPMSKILKNTLIAELI